MQSRACEVADPSYTQTYTRVLSMHKPSNARAPRVKHNGRLRISRTMLEPLLVSSSGEARSKKMGGPRTYKLSVVVVIM